MAEMDYSRMMQVLGTGHSTVARQPLSTRQAGDLAFHTQMQMALNVFRGDAESSGRTAAPSVSGSAMHDAMMWDALSTISRLMGENNPLERQQPMNVVRASVPTRAENVAAAAGPQRNAVVDGALSALFESGEKGAEAIGYDRVGGTSYGKFQIASRTGSMHDFLNFLDDRAPEWSKRLRAAGPANTGGRHGGMPRVWRKIAAEAPERFEKLQREFIREDHYAPARDKILARTGVDVDNLPLAAREVLWSTAVQHGATGAAEIFGQAIAGLRVGPENDQFTHRLIDEVYDNRKTQFGSSSRRVRASVQGRMDREKELALALLDTGSLDALA